MTLNGDMMLSFIVIAGVLKMDLKILNNIFGLKRKLETIEAF